MANYLYNGVKLPALPERDKETYPYAGIFQNRLSKGYFLRCLSADAYYHLINDSVYYSSTECLQYKASETEWGESEVLTGDYSYIALNSNNVTPLIWTNFDAEYNGTLYLAASEPVPILAPVIDPLRLFLGWKAGNWVARQRGKA